MVRKVEAIFHYIFSRRTLAKFASISVNLEVRKTKGSSSKPQPTVGLFNRREGYQLEDKLTLAGGQKIVRVCKQSFTGNPTTWDNFMRGYTQSSGNKQNVNPSRRVNPTWSIYKGKGYPAYPGNPSCFVNTTKKKKRKCTVSARVTSLLG